MKTQVIQLDAHDDVTSVRDKISWAKTERILLVFPRRSRILGRALYLRLLQRHAAMLGAQLAIVARSFDLRRVAQGLGIPAFTTVASARRQGWEKDKATAVMRRGTRPDLHRMRRDAFLPEARWRSAPVFRVFFFTLAVLAVLAILSLFIPSASIQLAPASRLQSLNFTIRASRNVSTVNLAGNIPARLTLVVVEHSKTVQTTGSITIPDSPAKGMARFRNLTTTLTGIPAGTVVSTQTTPPVRFATTVDALVAAGVGKTVDVPIQALEAGSTGNLPAGTLAAFEEVDLGTSLAVTNPDPITGGSDRTAAIQTAADRSLLHQALLAELLDECKINLPQTLAAGDTYFPDTPSVSQILSETYFPAEGQSGDTLSLTMRLQCQARYASLADVNALAEMALDANVPDGFAPIAGGLAVLPASTPLTDANGITHWDVQTQRLLRARLDRLIALQFSLGRKPADAAQRLVAALPLAGTPVIRLTPNWWPWLPLIPFRITVSTGN